MKSLHRTILIATMITLYGGRNSVADSIINGSAEYEYRVDRDKITQAVSKPTKEFYAEIKRLEDKWKTRETREYLELMAYASELLITTDHGRDGVALAQQIAMRTLFNVKHIPIDIEIKLASTLMVQTSSVSSEKPIEENLKKERLQKVELAIMAWEDFETTIDRSFDPSSPKYRATRNVVPPASVRGGVPGMAPDAITDPVARAEYEQAIAKNSATIENRELQKKLQEEDPDFPNQMERLLIALYKQPNADHAELEKMLKIRKIPTEAKIRIISAIKERPSSATQSANQ